MSTVQINILYIVYKVIGSGLEIFQCSSCKRVNIKNMNKFNTLTGVHEHTHTHTHIQ